ncbi:MAG: proteasome subunit beta [Nitrospirota bacterium]
MSVPHGTTVLALKFQGGVIVAGDRRATEGYSIAERRIEKVHAVDETSVMAIAGAAGPCMEMVRLLRVELEHYEKIEGIKLSMEGKASKLASMIKMNMPMAMQGLVVMPLFAGFDAKRNCCRIYKYDVAGGQYEEAEYYAIGSGGRDARGSMKKIFKKDLSHDEAIGVALEALYDAAEADVATGGPDWVRGIFPIVKVITEEGIETVSDPVLKEKLSDLIVQQGE